jgi:transcriptional regulator with XRE-family HTH domain
MDDGVLGANRTEQVRLYGSTIADVVADLTAALNVSQNRLAQIIGISAPMLSQLATGHRVKVGNPVVLQKIMRLQSRLPELADGSLAAEDALAALGDDVALLTRGTGTAPARVEVGPRAGGPALQSVFRAVASARDWEAVAEQVEADYPEIATVLRVYGSGTATEANAHLLAIAHLL